MFGVPLEPRGRNDPAPLTASQRNLWRYTVRHGASTIGAVTSAARIRGQLDTELLRLALEGVVHRHEALRTRVVSLQGTATQLVDAARRFDIDAVDLSNVPQAVARSAAEEFAECAVDSSAGPLFRAVLLRLAPQEHVLVWAADHMICDGASAAIINKEIWIRYESCLHADVTSLPPLQLQFPDLAVWQARTYDVWRSHHEAYWRARLAGAPQLSLPPELDATAAMAPAGASSHTAFGKKLSAELRALAKRHDVRLLHVILAAYACTMSRWLDQRDLVIALATHGRHWDPELKGMIGCLAAGLLLRIELHPGDTFAVLLERIRRELDASFDHYDFDRVAELLSYTTELSFNWVSPTLMQSSQATSVRRSLPVQVLPFPLKLAWLGKLFAFVGDTPSGIAASVTYRPDLYRPGSMRLLGQHLCTFAQAMAAEPSRHIGAVRC